MAKEQIKLADSGLPGIVAIKLLYLCAHVCLETLTVIVSVNVVQWQ